MRVSFSRVAVLLALKCAFTACAARRLTCRDGDPNIVIPPHGAGGAPFCNHDEPLDRVCTFAICGLCPFIRSVGPNCGVFPQGRSLPWGAKETPSRSGRQVLLRAATRVANSPFLQRTASFRSRLVAGLRPCPSRAACADTATAEDRRAVAPCASCGAATAV